MKDTIENQSEKILPERITRVVSWMLFGLLIATVLVRYAEPTKDGDVFFHLAYGKTIIESRTLTPDHTIYSWTDTVNDQIYCAWLGQVLLYLIHGMGGFPLLFLFRYACLFLTLGILWMVSRNRQLHASVFPVLLLLMVSIGSYAGVFLKPEIFSLIFMTVLAFLYFQAKFILYGTWSYRLLLWLPVLFWLWINTHGVWMFGFIIFTIMPAGEILNKYFGRKDRFDPALLKYLSVSYLATLFVLPVNPYGWAYAVQPLSRTVMTVLSFLNPVDTEAGIENIYAYGSIFKTIHDPNMHIVSLWGMMTLLVVGFFILHIRTAGRPDWGILLINVLLCFLFARYMRANYYWGPFWFLSVLYFSIHVSLPPFLSKPIVSRMIYAGTVVLVLGISVSVVYQSVRLPYKNNWLGFGLNNWAPVEAATFLKEHRPGTRLFNSYMTGAYLMYALYPDYKVFIDARRFPYKVVFSDFRQFQNGKMDLETFNELYPFDVALVDYSSDRIFIRFFNSGIWKPAYYDSAAAVFVRQSSDADYDLKKAPLDRFDRLGNMDHSIRVFAVAMNFNDMPAAEYILDHMRRKFKCIKGYQQIMASAGNKLDGLKAYQAQEYDTAFHLLSRSDDGTVIPVTQTLIHLRVLKAKQLAGERKYSQALALMEKNLERLPNHPDFLYSAGVMAYFSQDVSRENTLKFKRYFDRFLSQFPDHPHTEVIRKILDNQEGLSIPLGL